MRRISSSFRPTVAGSSAGSPTGSEPSGSSRAARWPCMRCALTSEVAACTAWSSAASATGAAAGAVARGHGLGGGHARRLGRRLHAHRSEHRVVEAVLALKQLVDPAQERARLGALDHAVVVGRGHRHDLLHAQLGELRRVGRRQAGRVADGAGGDDRALPGHEPRHAGHGADAARIGERDVGALVGVGLERVVARAHDQLVVAGDEVGEAELAGVAQHRHDQRAGAVLALHVDGEAEADGRGGHALRLAVLLGVGVPHDRHVARGLDDRPGDQVRERQLLAGAP